MSNLLWEQAQTAINAGNKREAHVHLANLLKQEPANVEAWYLLSTVSPPEKRELFLNKVLKFDPTHADALADLATLHQPAEPIVDVTVPALPISVDEDDFDAQAAAGTMPDWMSDAPTISAEVPTIVESDVASDVTLLEEPIPDWLKDSPATMLETKEPGAFVCSSRHATPPNACPSHAKAETNTGKTRYPDNPVNDWVGNFCFVCRFCTCPIAV